MRLGSNLCCDDILRDVNPVDDNSDGEPVHENDWNRIENAADTDYDSLVHYGHLPLTEQKNQ